MPQLRNPEKPLNWPAVTARCAAGTSCLQSTAGSVERQQDTGLKVHSAGGAAVWLKEQPVQSLRGGDEAGVVRDSRTHGVTVAETQGRMR